MISEIDTDSSGTVDFDGKLINLITSDVTFCQKNFYFLVWIEVDRKIPKSYCKIAFNPLLLTHAIKSFRSKVLEKCSLIMSEKQSNQFSYERSSLSLSLDDKRNVELLIIYELSSHIYFYPPHTHHAHTILFLSLLVP